MRPPGRAGFTLIELAIVIVVIALIVGAVLAGRELILTSTLNKAAVQFGEMQTRINLFQDRYRALPGDMANATSYFGSSTGNGNGNGIIQYGNNSNEKEMLKIWRHLFLAGLIDEDYTGDYASPVKIVGGENAPVSSLGKSNIFWIQYVVRGVEPYGGVAYMDYMRTGHHLVLAKAIDYWHPFSGNQGIEAAWVKQIDNKLDDGLPLSGKVYPQNYANHCNIGNEYAVKTTAPECHVYFLFN